MLIFCRILLYRRLAGTIGLLAVFFSGYPFYVFAGVNINGSKSETTLAVTQTNVPPEMRTVAGRSLDAQIVTSIENENSADVIVVCPQFSYNRFFP